MLTLPLWTVQLVNNLRWFDCKATGVYHNWRVFNDINRRLFLALECCMARQTNRFGKGKADDLPFVFVDLKLSKQDDAHFTIWYKENETLLGEFIEEFVSNSLKLSVTYDLNNDCVISSITCVDRKSENLNACVTSRSKDTVESLFMSFYKVLVMLKDKPWRELEIKNDWG